MNKVRLLLHNRAVKYLIASVITICLPMFYILFWATTSYQIYLPQIHIYGVTLGLLLQVIFLLFYPRFVIIASTSTIFLLSSWLFQTIAFGIYYLTCACPKTETWQPLTFWEAFIRVTLGHGEYKYETSFWLIVLIPLAVSLFLIIQSSSVESTSNKNEETNTNLQAD